MTDGRKVFGIGFHGTGYDGLARSLEALGYRVVWAGSDTWPPGADDFDAATGDAVAADFTVADERWPGSRFICTLRERDAWLASVTHEIDLMRDLSFGWSGTLEQLYGRDLAALRLERHFLEAYDRHLAKVRAHFAGRPGDVLFLDQSATFMSARRS